MDQKYELITGDALSVLKRLPENYIDCCITSPPYWNLRDYGIEGQIGREKTLEMYISKLVDIFTEVYKILKPTGTFWLNLGDCYDKNSNLVGVPWKASFALQDSGWILRSDIIFQKINPLPESVLNRPIRSHEYLFFFIKQKEYFYDGDAIRVPYAESSKQRAKYMYKSTRDKAGGEKQLGIQWSGVSEQTIKPNEKGCSKRDVWSVSTKPYKGAHFATFPPKLIEPAMLAGCPTGGLCLDPFSGSGTTGEVALEHGRKYIGIELNPNYQELAKERLKKYLDK